METDPVRVEKWSMIAGKIREVKIYHKGKTEGDIVALHENIPEGIDPIEAIKDFYRVVDLERTKILKKANGNTCLGAKKKKKPYVQETGKLIGKYNMIKIYDDKVNSIYRNYPNGFDSGILSDFFSEKLYPTLSKTTLINRANGYIKYMRTEGIIEASEPLKGVTKTKVWYTFKKPPEGVEPAAQADELDRGYWQNTKLRTLQAIRDN